MFICHSANRFRQEGEKKESGGEVNLLIPQSSNMPSLNRLKSKHSKSQCGRDNQKILLSFYTTQEYQKQDALFQPLVISIILASDAWACYVTCYQGRL